MDSHRYSQHAGVSLPNTTLDRPALRSPLSLTLCGTSIEARCQVIGETRQVANGTPLGAEP